ncbi:MAG: GNAT family N-acetyltransferase [Clostridiales bacterium]|nr:GNAT family N-acetyltransferase [Clostridiales bacterium]
MPENNIIVRPYRPEDLPAMAEIWNQVVEDGVAFPQLELLDVPTAEAFFGEQDLSAVAEMNGTVCGLYILHPNNIGRCGHICNASYAVYRHMRGQGVGRALVTDCLRAGRELGYRLLQFNAVVASNTYARRLYEQLGFVQLGVIPGGFLMPDGHYEDICPYYHEL